MLDYPPFIPPNDYVISRQPLVSLGVLVFTDKVSEDCRFQDRMLIRGWEGGGSLELTLQKYGVILLKSVSWF